MVSTQLRILRVFGLTSAEVTAILRQAQADGCTGLRLLERDGEFAVCVQASAPTQAMADAHCDKWAQKLAARFGDAVYATGETSLAQATLDALLQKRRLLVATDETTGRLLGDLLRPLEHGEAVFDFGTHSYADPIVSRDIVTPPQLLKKFPGDVVQAAAGRAQQAMDVGEADIAAVYMPATVGQAPFVLICDRKGAVACALRPDLTDAAIANNILDLVRRRTLGLKFTSGTIQFHPGHEHPLLLVSRAGQTRGDTTRFSLRRRRSGGRSSFEPMLDFDTAAIPKSMMQDAAAAAVAASMGEDNPQQDTQTDTARPARPVPDNAADVAAAAHAAAEQSWNSNSPKGSITFENADPPQAAAPLDFATNGAKAAADYRAARSGGRRLTRIQRDTGTATRSQPPRSILDDDVPDLTSGLDPEAVRAAQQADDQSPPTSLEDFRDAVEHLSDEQPARKASAPVRRTTRVSRKKENSTAEAMPAMDLGQSRSLARVLRNERRQSMAMTAVFVGFLVVILALAGALFYFLNIHSNPAPSADGYGTAQFDSAVTEYLAEAAGRDADVAGYLAFPGMEGKLVYLSGASGEEAPDGPAVSGTSYLGSEYPANTLLEMNDKSLDVLADLTTLRENTGFTFYLADTSYRYEVLAVYYQDPNETGAGAFDVSGRPLTEYSEYLNFVLGARARSLADVDLSMTDHAGFLTLASEPGNDGVRLCVTGRLATSGSGELSAGQVELNSDPLLPAVRYGTDGDQMPDVGALLGDQLEWYLSACASTGTASPESAEEGSGNEGKDQPAAPTGVDTQALDQNIADLQAQTNQLMTDVDKLLAGLTDKAGEEGAAESDVHQGAEGTLPEQEISVEQIASANPTPAPTPTPAPESSGGTDNSQPAAQATPAPESSGGSSAAGETINVTMNGSQQTLDLVTCLAMIAQNELGPGAPAEAYKAQCVAAHCWIISQGGYPSVAGTTPGDAALAAAQEVAHVLVTYGGNVCFTPYFASASTGTASAADVWGSDRAWLQAVDSPYDQSTASHWNTNGATSGTARFSRATLQQRIQDVLGIDLSGVDPNSWFKILSANQYGWVSQMQIGPDSGPNTTCRGSWFRETLLAGQSVDGRSLRSQCFTVSYDSASDCFIFDVYGYGHGVGMSQWGAVGYANNGWSYQQILQHYYPGTSLTTY